MDSVTWIHHLFQDLRASQIKTFTAIWVAFIQCESAILNKIAAQMMRQSGIGVEHTLKRINRFLSNPRIDRRVVYAGITRFVWRRIRHWKTVPIAWDWTYCEEYHEWQVFAASVIVRGRGIPILVWAFKKNKFGSELSQNRVEEAFLRELHELIKECRRPNQTIVIMADRGFPRPKLFELIRELDFHYVIRITNNVSVTMGKETMAVGNIALAKGEQQTFHSIKYRRDKALTIPRLVAVRPKRVPKGKKLDPWFLVSSLCRGSDAIIRLYELRFTIEEDFRTMKSNFNWGKSRIHLLEHYRQFLLLVVVAMLFAFMIGLAAHTKPSLMKGVVRRRKGKPDTSITVTGHRLLLRDLDCFAYIGKIDKLPYPL